MDIAHNLILVGAALALISIMVSAIASKAGAPLLFVFLAIGMIAREWGVRFASFDSVYVVGTLALAIILFDGGMRTRAESSFREVSPAISLATVGVFVTAFVIALSVHFIFSLGWLESFLIGAIVGSTDAAAVFSLLHARGSRLKQRVGTTLEIESGCNDPMAVFLTLLLIGFIDGSAVISSVTVIWEFFYQFGMGLIIGVVGGKVLVQIIKKINITVGLYPLLAAAGGLTVYGAASSSGASGFLAIYVSGLILGNTKLHAANNIRKVHDGLAWLSQIILFLMLGLLMTPKALMDHGWMGLSVALVLIFVARPVATVVSLLPFRFPWKEQAFISWVGLRGAVPIVLAIFPILAGIPLTDVYLNIAFVCVLLSLVIQGWSVIPLAEKLKLKLPTENTPYYEESLEVPGQTDLTMLGYRIADSSPIIGRRVDSLLLPDDMQIVAIFNNNQSVHPFASHEVSVGDLLYLIVPQESIQVANQALLSADEVAELEQANYFGDFVLNGDAKIEDIVGVYGGDVPSKIMPLTLSEFLAIRFKGKCAQGDRVFVGSIELVAREIGVDGIVAKVGLRVRGN